MVLICQQALVVVSLKENSVEIIYFHQCYYYQCFLFLFCFLVSLLRWFSDYSATSQAMSPKFEENIWHGMTFNNMLENFARKSSKNQGHSNKGRPEVKLLFGYSGFWSCPLNPLALVLPGGQVYSLVVVIYFFWSNKQPFQFVSDSVPTFVVVWIRKKLRTKHVPLYLQLHGHMQRTEFKWSEFPFNGTVLGVGAENDKDIIWDTLVVRTNYPLPIPHSPTLNICALS